MDDLVRWLCAQLDEDERIARAAGGRSEQEWEADLSGKDPLGMPSWPVAVRYTTDGRMRGAVANLPVMQERSEDRMAHIAEWDPARVLREIDARRRLVELHDGEVVEVINADRQERSGECCLECGEPSPCRTLRTLALPYGVRPGYRNEWAP